jgi:hypothetical protein
MKSKVSQLKTLIKEAVREVLTEDLLHILESANTESDREDTTTVKEEKVKLHVNRTRVENFSPIEAIMEATRAEMVKNPVNESIEPSISDTGLDLSGLNFIQRGQQILTHSKS